MIALTVADVAKALNVSPKMEILRKLLAEASEKMSYGHWSTDFRNRVKEAVK